MNCTAFRVWWMGRTRWEQTALVVWIAILLFVSVRVFLSPETKTVYPIFSSSSRLWWDADELYDPHRPPSLPDGYRYGPTIAMLFTPFAVFPDAVGGVLWRLFGVATFAGSLAWLGRRVLPGPLPADYFARLLLLCTPLALQSLNNGQTNLVVIATMLGAVAAVQERRWNLASGLLALAFVCKIFPLALGFLLILLYPRQLGWRLLLFCGASLLLPFLTHSPDYVIDQYEKWFVALKSEDRSATLLRHMYRDLWLLIHIYGVPISRSVYQMIQISGGILIAGVIWYRRRAGWSEQALLTGTLALAVTWMMLLGPSPESSSFILLAPSLAWSIVAAFQTKPWNPRNGLLAGSVALYVPAVLLGSFSLTVIIHTYGVHSWATLLYFAYLLTEPRPAETQANLQQEAISLRQAA